ncbi:hypothetical protein Ade02nite_96920 [Paractinoplanes deccanensis]|uniref:TetR family transcriptional regulator n=1 Tax=Paractinoplanes deccanensis TaxID=113561 RepID=A0ABQ3YM24_9ACTN|nr:hypothetical protein Ade02nite_96920 [Actinoplanes deccanensis]
MDFLEELAQRPSERWATALEHMFLFVKDQPELLGREYFPDQVVAAAAIVAASLPGGGQFGERLETVAENDLAPDVRLAAPAPELAGMALDALLFVAGPWRQGWATEADASRARDTATALSRVLSGA